MSTEFECLCIAPPSRVLLATDLTDLKQLLPVAIEYALKYKAELKLVHVLPDVKTPDIDPTLLTNVDPVAVQHYAEAILKDAAKTVVQAGVKCNWITRTGHVAETINQIVQEWRPDRVVVGSHGNQKFQQKLLGSVAEAIFREIEVPVLAIGPRAVRNKALTGERPHILFATALDRESRIVTESVLEYARTQHADLTLLHVIPDIADAHPSLLRVRGYAERTFQEILHEIPLERQQPSCLIEKGQTVETILRVAEQGHFDLILLGRISGSTFRREIMPGTAHGVLCGAPCPVLILKQSSRPRPDAVSVAS